MTPTAVIQVKQGIGDVIWHLPYVRAIAAAEPGSAITFLAPPTSHAKELLQAEPCVGEVIYFEHGGSQLRRGVNLIRLVALMRRARFRKIWILDRTVRPALAALLAGIPERIGVGFTKQRPFITNAGIDERHFHEMPTDWLRALLAEMHVPLVGDRAEPHAACCNARHRGRALCGGSPALGCGGARRLASDQGLAGVTLDHLHRHAAAAHARHGLPDRRSGKCRARRRTDRGERRRDGDQRVRPCPWWRRPRSCATPTCSSDRIPGR